MTANVRVLTFDIEEWFHLLDNSATRTEKEWDSFPSRIEKTTDVILDILQETNTRATFFCLGWIGKKYPHIIKKIDSLGYEIASHSCMHQLAYEQTPQAFFEDVKQSVGILQNSTGKKVRIFRTPGFSLTRETPWAFDALIENGIEVDTSIFPAPRAHGGFAGFGEAKPTIIERQGKTLREFPINLFPLLGRNIVFSGGGYFRLFPYALVKYMTKKSPYVMTYFHPRDFDPSQPMVPGLSKIRQFKSYYGLSTSLKRFKQWIKDFSFVDMHEAEKSVDWSLAPKIQL